jgi:hypothetical protein
LTAICAELNALLSEVKCHGLGASFPRTFKDGLDRLVYGSALPVTAANRYNAHGLTSTFARNDTATIWRMQ